MCTSRPSIPAPPPPPPPPQEMKTPDMAATRRKPAASDNSPIVGGTLLTGPSGVSNSALNVGGKSLLGG